MVMIHRGDWRGGALKGDVVISDPPYNIGFRYGAYSDTMADAAFIEMLCGLREVAPVIALLMYPEETARYITPALGVPDAVMAWCYSGNIPRRFRLASIFGRKPAYDRIKQPYKNADDARVRALIDAGAVGTNIYEWFSDIQLVKNVSGEKTAHPCPIPEALAERLVVLLSDPGQTVVDPFAGSGTVGVAALINGRKFIGAELDPAYADIAEARLGAILPIASEHRF